MLHCGNLSVQNYYRFADLLALQINTDASEKPFEAPCRIGVAYPFPTSKSVHPAFKQALKNLRMSPFVKAEVYTETALARKTSADFKDHLASSSESIRLLRLRVEKIMTEEEKKILLISSAIPGEGKTTMSVNLAISMAQRGRRVLLIDCDLRNPSVAKSLQLDAKYSLSDYLQGQVTVKDIICPTEVENLFVIPGGGDASDMELITEGLGVAMVQAARNMYDFVILDTPPCSMLADAGEVAELADAGLLVVRQDFASRDQILDGVQRLGDADLPMIGWILNHAQRSLSSRDDYGYGYSGIYGYEKKHERH
jgi:receptor protein-tyrosine kinase